MCYSDKIASLVDAIRPLIPFTDVKQAEQYNTFWQPVVISGKTPDEIKAEEAWKQAIKTEIDERALEIHKLALKYPETDLGRAVSAIVASPDAACKVRLSALREAIRECASARLERREARIERELAMV